MSGIKKSGNRPKTAAHLRVGSEKKFIDTTKEDRERRHHETDTWAEKQRERHVETEEDRKIRAADARRQK